MYSEASARIAMHSRSFMNPEARFSRDFSVAMVSYYTKELQHPNARLLDSTAATGIRAIRYCKEAGIRRATCLEINRSAFRDLSANVAHNRLKSRIEPINMSIQEFANTTRAKFDVIDLDPFGSPVPNINDLLKITSDGALMMVTATDTAVLCGAQERACRKIYDSRPIHNKLCYESGARILLGYIARQAAQFNFGIGALAAFYNRHYIRAFVILSKGAKQASESIDQLGYVGYCTKCSNVKTAKGAYPKSLNCGYCGSEMQFYGRLWLGSIKSDAAAGYASRYFEQSGYPGAELRIAEAIKSEIATPFYYHIPSITKLMKARSVGVDEIMQRLSAAGYESSKTHFESSSIKSTAGIHEVRDAIENALKHKN
ncbi:MAG: hypothetical protein LVQ97_00550 [Candidatus Micrarchaeales archaeon]|jgi:tRNA(guanine-26,N2-N2) methyltransferase|uniref:tRNA (guanine(26)-N(2))-dimethyltransferase n=1 Tax=Candidatus Micrarchaeum acidiphilum ARMAN-2 TaxID=425595 RepID=C7DHJ0_MICA2|nr:MAG: tRNA (guanine-N(2)-)-methyltransferase [Candidatus Micrarchaeum acidiphilum ARMAN-2]MCW6160661.1 hypothetical protein [Candidatus Micrarchaeales archaeon]